MKHPCKLFEKSLGHRFRAKTLLEAALTHPSHRNERGEEESADNQRLEFLGDAVIGLLTAEYLFAHRREWREGEMTKFRSGLANQNALAEMGERWELGALLRLGKGEAQSGGAAKKSNLADAVEAVLGAVYLDGGIKAASKVFTRHFVPVLEERMAENPDEDNPKGRLQEHTQRERQNNPEYVIVEERGPAHARDFVAAVTWDGVELARGSGASKRVAEAEAARRALRELQRSRS